MFSPDTQLLIVDDMMTMRKIVTKSCQAMGFKNFTEAADGIKAWEALTNAKIPIGLVICDWNMPNCTGIDLLKRVRADSRFKSLPFILVTAESEKHQIVEAAQNAVSGYVVKPFTPELLRVQVEGAFKKLMGKVAA